MVTLCRRRRTRSSPCVVGGTRCAWVISRRRWWLQPGRNASSRNGRRSSGRHWLGGRGECRLGTVARARFSVSWRRSRVGWMLDGARGQGTSDDTMRGIVMRTPGRLALVAAALLVLAADPALSTAPAGDGGSISRRGTYAGGRYMIEVPARWNGGLVIFAHGYGGAQASPLASHLAANGYAWAASSYRSGGYRP